MNLFDIDVPALLTAVGICVQIFFINLLLSADNAIMIAMACRSLPPSEMRLATILGTVGAIVLRVAMTAAVLYLLQIPYLKIVAGATLLVIAVRLTVEQDDMYATNRAWHGLRAAVVAIIVADAVMSVDNVVAIAAVAQGSLWLMVFGLVLSIPMLITGATMIRTFFTENGLLVTVAGMFLGWVAGQIAVSDPTLAPWIAANAPAVEFALPAACGIFVLWESRILAGARVPASEAVDV